MKLSIEINCSKYKNWSVYISYKHSGTFECMTMIKDDIDEATAQQYIKEYNLIKQKETEFFGTSYKQQSQITK